MDLLADVSVSRRECGKLVPGKLDEVGQVVRVTALTASDGNDADGWAAQGKSRCAVKTSTSSTSRCESLGNEENLVRGNVLSGVSTYASVLACFQLRYFRMLPAAPPPLHHPKKKLVHCNASDGYICTSKCTSIYGPIQGTLDCPLSVCHVCTYIRSKRAGHMAPEPRNTGIVGLSKGRAYQAIIVLVRLTFRQLSRLLRPSSLRFLTSVSAYVSARANAHRTAH